MIAFLLFVFCLYKASKYIFFTKYFNHNCVVITGGAGALGTKLAELFINSGRTTVILLDIDADKLETVKKLLPGVITVQCDICNYEELNNVVKTLLDKYNIDTLINNAGVVTKKKLLELTPEEIARTFNVNTIAPIHLTKLLLPNMIKSERGHIINVSSVAGLVGINRLTDYCASKSALIGFNDALRAEVSHYNNIHTSCLCPYFFRSDLFSNSRGYPWPLNYIMYVYSTDDIAKLIFKDIKVLKEFRIYPQIFGWLIRLRYIFPKYIQDRFISLGSNID
jgi:short-subunit dehydrogenase